MNKSLPLAALLTVVSIGLSCACSSRPDPQAPRLSTQPPATGPGQVLFLLTESSEQRLANGKTTKTGYFLNEFYLPVMALKEAGYTSRFATRTGGPPALDPESVKDKYWSSPTERDAALAYVRSNTALQKPLSVEEIVGREDEFQGLVVPGGQGVMVDLLDDPRVPHLILSFAEKKKAIGLICHAPALLSRLPSEEHALSGRKVTSVTGLEEFYIETFVMGGEAEERRIGRSLERRGFNHDSALPKANHAVRDCGLVTSQNPYSGEAFNAAFLPTLLAVRQGQPCAE